MDTILLFAKDMDCQSCSAEIETLLENAKWVEDYVVNLMTKEIEIDYDTAQINEQEIFSFFKHNGIDVKKI